MHLNKPDMFKKYFKGRKDVSDEEFKKQVTELKKDSIMFDTQIKRNYHVKKLCFNKIKQDEAE